MIFSGELFAKNPSVHPDCVPVIVITESKNGICIDTAVTFHTTVTNEGTNAVYKWKRNNLDAGINNNPDYTAADFHEGDIVSCEYSCKTTCGTDTTVVSNSITVHVINDIAPIISIANNDTLICEGNLTVFTAQAYYGNAQPFYQWKVNGIPVGTNKPDYETDSLTNGSKVECTLTISTAGCPGASRSSTAQMNIYVYPMVHPAIKITPSRTQICRGEEVVFTATANGGAFPSFTWEINGIRTGDMGPSLTSSKLKDGDSISCIITIDQDSRCHTTTSAPSNKVGIHVLDYIEPIVTIAAPVLDACAGEALTFIATGQNTGDYKSYQWQVNDQGAGNNSLTFITNQLKNGDKVSCILSTNIVGCAFNASASSNYEVVTIRDNPVITFLPPEISVMSGESAQLNASVTGSMASVTWEPESILVTPQALTSATASLSHDTVFNLTVVDVNGCKASKELVVKVLFNMHIPSAFTPNNDRLNDVFRIPPGSSVTLKEFSVIDRWGNVVFRTTDITKGWNGKYQSRNLDAGIFVYLIKGVIKGKEVMEKGTVTLIR